MKVESSKYDVEKGELSLKDLIIKIKHGLEFLISKWYILAIAGILGGFFGFLYAESKKTTFTALTTFVLESSEGSGSGALSQFSGVASMIGMDLGNGGGGIFQGDNLFEFYKSRKMLEATLLKVSVVDSSQLLIDRFLKLERDGKKNNSEIDFRKQYTGLLKRQRDSIMNNVIADIVKKNLRVDKLDKKLSIIKVEVTTFDEGLAQEFNMALVKEVNDFYVQTKTKKSLENVAILQHKTDSVRSVLNGNIATAAVIADATPNLNPTRQAQRLVPTQRSQLSVEANKAILSQLVQNLELSKMTLLREAPLIQVIDVPITPLVKKEVEKNLYIAIGFFLLFLVTSILLLIIRLYNNIMNEVASS